MSKITKYKCDGLGCGKTIEDDFIEDMREHGLWDGPRDYCPVCFWSKVDKVFNSTIPIHKTGGSDIAMADSEKALAESGKVKTAVKVS